MYIKILFFENIIFLGKQTIYKLKRERERELRENLDTFVSDLTLDSLKIFIYSLLIFINLTY